ncbi:MAG: transposase [Gammaproteobacteria bacterium]|nr:transposase [Gammaproteobacteria bacterium]
MLILCCYQLVTPHIAKLEVTDKSSNPRLIVTNLPGSAQALNDTVYCVRGDMGNRIKELQLGLFMALINCNNSKGMSFIWFS